MPLQPIITFKAKHTRTPTRYEAARSTRHRHHRRRRRRHRRRRLPRSRRQLRRNRFSRKISSSRLKRVRAFRLMSRS